MSVFRREWCKIVPPLSRGVPAVEKIGSQAGMDSDSRAVITHDKYCNTRRRQCSLVVINSVLSRGGSLRLKRYDQVRRTTRRLVDRLLMTAACSSLFTHSARRRHIPGLKCNKVVGTV